MSGDRRRVEVAGQGMAGRPFQRAGALGTNPSPPTDVRRVQSSRRVRHEGQLWPIVGTWIILLGMLTAVAMFEAVHAAGYTQTLIDDYDEGAYTISAQLLLAGYHLFTPVFSAQPAWFLGSLSLGLRLLGQPTLSGSYLVIGFCGLLALVGTAWIAWASYGRLSALIAVAVLALSPGFLALAHAVEAEMPMTAFALLALGAAAQHARTPRRSLLCVAGLCLAASAEMKLLAAVFLLPIVLLVLLPSRAQAAQGVTSAARRQRLLPALALLAGVALAPVALTLVLISPADQIDQVLTMHIHAGSATTLNVGANLQLLQTFLQLDWALPALAVVGAISGLWRWPSGTLIYLLWLAGSITFSLFYHPAFNHQLLIVLPPLAILAGAVGRSLSTALTRRPTQRSPTLSPQSRAGAAWHSGERTIRLQDDRARGLSAPRWVMAALFALGAIAYGGLLPRTWAADQGLFTSATLTPRDTLAAFVAYHTGPGEMIITDDLHIALLAGRLVPPPLDDPSRIRVAAGYLTTAQVIAATQQYHVKLVALWRNLYSERLPLYITWLRQHGYRPVVTHIQQATVFLHP